MSLLELSVVPFSKRSSYSSGSDAAKSRGETVFVVDDKDDPERGRSPTVGCFSDEDVVLVLSSSPFKDCINKKSISKTVLLPFFGYLLS